MQDPLAPLMGQQVEVVTSQCRYQGKLVEVTEEYVALQADLSFHQLEVTEVLEIRPLSP